MENPEFSEAIDAVHHERFIRIICIGAGASGLCFAYKLQRSFRNFSLSIYEKNAGVAGTWYENTYPGCACDIPAHNYTFTFEPKHDWSTVYASQTEIKDYFIGFSNKYGLDQYIKTNHEVSKAFWSEEKGEWSVTIKDLVSEQSFVECCDILIQASGYLNSWRWPDITGLDKFKGMMLHTAKWDDTIDLKGKRVGLIGNGPSGVQILPAIQPIVKTLTVFVRSPTWVAPTIGTEQRAYSQKEIKAFAEDPQSLTARRKANETMMNSIFSELFLAAMFPSVTMQHADLPGVYLENSRLQKRLKAFCMNEMKQRLQNDNLAERLIPKYDVGCSRISPSPGYLEAMHRVNVTTVLSGVVELTETGCICENGVEYLLDVLVCATGFDTTYQTRFPIIGPGGVTLQQDWRNELKSYLGIAAAAFPNYCMTLGPYSPVGAGSVIPIIETQVDLILQLLNRYQTETIHSFRPTPAAVSDFLDHTARFMPRTVWSQDCSSPFKTPASKGVPSLWPGSTLHYMEAIRELRADDWDIRYRENRFAFLGNGLSQAEFDPYCDLAYYITESDNSPWASRYKRREALTRSGTQRHRELHLTCRRDPSEIALESKDSQSMAGPRKSGFHDFLRAAYKFWIGKTDGL